MGKNFKRFGRKRKEKIITPVELEGLDMADFKRQGYTNRQLATMYQYSIQTVANRLELVDKQGGNYDRFFERISRCANR